MFPMKFTLFSSTLACSLGTFADTITVCESGCDYQSIQSALDAAAEQGDVIEIGAGIWMENLYTNKQMVLRGAGPGITIIDGSNSQFDSEPCLLVSEDFDGWETQDRFRIESLTLRGGSGAEIFGLVRGGGVYIEFVPVTISDVVIEDCSVERLGEFSVEGLGGAICNFYGDVSVESSVLRNNSAFTLGGAIFTEGPLQIFDTVIEGNIGEVEGGAIFSDDSPVSIEQSTICGNSERQIFGSFEDNGGNTIAEECSHQCPGDYDSNGHVNLEDLLQVVSNWKSPYTLDDLLVVLSKWGSSCM